VERGVIVLNRRGRRRLGALARRSRDAALRTRLLIVVHSAEGMGVGPIARALACHPKTVRKVRGRWLEEGEAGLIDRREDNGERKVTGAYAAGVLEVLAKSPPQFGHGRPTWTLRLLIQTMKDRMGIAVSLTTMSRLLKRLRVRRGRPKPLAPCPWREKARKARVRMIHRLVDSLPLDEAAVWEDEADIDLNPRIGPDWMLPGTQRQVLTPGKNVKRYLAGALDARTQRVAWVRGKKKDSGLFIALLKKLLEVYAGRRRVHVILDNYTIHSSRRTRAWLKEHGAKFRLHFLPPYCPDDNRIERKVWRELHANVTYNHTCLTIDALLAHARRWLAAFNRRPSTPVDELRKAI